MYSSQLSLKERDLYIISFGEVKFPLEGSLLCFENFMSLLMTGFPRILSNPSHKKP